MLKKASLVLTTLTLALWLALAAVRSTAIPQKLVPKSSDHLALGQDDLRLDASDCFEGAQQDHETSADEVHGSGVRQSG
jgi:hypothetical protein